MVVIFKRGSGLLLFAALFFLCHTVAVPQSKPDIEFDGGQVRVKNLDEEILFTFSRYYNTEDVWREVFPVFIDSYGEQHPMAGTYSVGKTSVTFIPRFPFAADIKYKAVFHYEQLTSNKNEVYLPAAEPVALAITFEKSRPKDPIDPQVLAIYPSSSQLPENILKVHVRFNSPMTYGEAYKRIRLFDETGEIERAFLVVDQEMWDDSVKLLTLTFDPGRVKRGLRPNVEMGTPLQEGEKYKLVVTSGWKNIDGKTTKKDFVKEFVCVAADRKSPKPGDWNIVSPQGATQPLLIKADEYFDQVLLSDAVRVTDRAGHNIRGIITTVENESGVLFQPDLPWNEGDFFLHINPLLEDLAGNNLNRVFDRDTSGDAGFAGGKSFMIPFSISVQ
jgi:hypothetical protein